METFKSNLKKKLKLTIFMACFVAIIVFLVGFMSYKTVGTKGGIADFILGMQFGIFIGLEVFISKSIIKYRKALKDANELKRFYIDENDERNKLISLSTGCKGLAVIMTVIATATIISGFFNEIIFFTLASVLFFTALTKTFLKHYYSRKF